MNQHLENTTSPKSKPIIQAAYRAMRAVIRIFGRELPVSTLVELLQRAALENALQQVGTQYEDGKASLSRLALLTGMDTRTIRRVQNEPRRMTELDICPEAAILDHWARDPTMRDRFTGKPMDLPIYGTTGTFQGLVNRYYGRGVSSALVAKRMEEAGVLTIRSKNWVVLKSKKWAWIEKDAEAFLESASRAFYSLASSLSANAPGHSEKCFERRVLSYKIPVRYQSEIKQLITEELNRCKKQVSLLIRKQEERSHAESAEANTVNGVIGVGFYYWADSGDDFPDN